ncbi:Hypothetical protein AA314_09852 [Archangium gephyra]|uniref:Uncharacterized protein n=1 Tax=Archangium gephyra TaxID=48 RepID=A0AAC8QJB9_9BACT|nr:Hypothetical protein AA314_09852 [Archangium gephyra]
MDAGGPRALSEVHLARCVLWGAPGMSRPAAGPAGVAGPALRTHWGIGPPSTGLDGALRSDTGRPRWRGAPANGRPLPALYRGQHGPPGDEAGVTFGGGCATRGGADAELGREAHRTGDTTGVGTRACRRTRRGRAADSRRTRAPRHR